MKSAVLYYGSERVTTRLAELGLTQELLREVVQEWAAAFSSCTKNDPTGAPGYFGWSRGIRALRERLIPLGWERRNEKNLPTVIDPTQKIAITVTSGDEGTGKANGQVRTKNPKGRATADRVERNQAQLEFKSILSTRQTYTEDPSLSLQRSGLTTWLLVIHRSEDEVRCEFSLPADIGDDGRVDSWIERVILEPVSLGTELNFNDVDYGSDIEVAVIRKERE